MAHLDRSGRGPGLPARPIYLDYNATTPVDPLVLEALLPALERDFGNPSSAHAFGDAPRRALGLARAGWPPSSAPHRTRSCSPPAARSPTRWPSRARSGRRWRGSRT